MDQSGQIIVQQPSPSPSHEMPSQNQTYNTSIHAQFKSNFTNAQRIAQICPNKIQSAIFAFNLINSENKIPSFTDIEIKYKDTRIPTESKTKIIDLINGISITQVIMTQESNNQQTITQKQFVDITELTDALALIKQQNSKTDQKTIYKGIGAIITGMGLGVALTKFLPHVFKSITTKFVLTPEAK
jgi:hypothetical protein